MQFYLMHLTNSGLPDSETPRAFQIWFNSDYELKQDIDIDRLHLVYTGFIVQGYIIFHSITEGKLKPILFLSKLKNCYDFNVNLFLE